MWNYGNCVSTYIDEIVIKYFDFLKSCQWYDQNDEVLYNWLLESSRLTFKSTFFISLKMEWGYYEKH